MAERLDVAVVGASQAGLFLARLLAEAGLRVEVFEQRPEDRPPARRTLIITPYLVRKLRVPPGKSDRNRVRVMALESPGARAEVPFRDPDLIIERAAFLEELAERAQEAGATIRWGHRFVGAEPDNGGVRVLLQRNGGITGVRADILVGADGALTRVGQVAGIGRPPVVSVIHAEVRLPQDWDPQVAKVWFDTRQTRFFYWLMAEDDRRGVVGIADERHWAALPLLRAFLDRFGLEASGFQAARVALHHPRLKPWGTIGHASVYLVGDAAGQVKVTTVGGTVTGLRGAQALARAILRGTSYREELSGLKRELDLHWWIKVFLDHLDNHGYDLLVRKVRDYVRDFLARHTRDEMFASLWRLLLRDPSLVLWGLRQVLKKGKRWGRRWMER